MNPIKDIYNSFNTDKGGFSSRKLAAFTAVVAAIIVSVKHADASNAFNIVCANYLFALLCLGLVTASQLISFKTGTTTNKESIEIKKETTKTDGTGV